MPTSSSEMGKGSARAKIYNKNILVFSEKDVIQQKDHGFFKQLVGRDILDSEVKNLQGAVNLAFEGVVVLTCNSHPSFISYNNALFDNLIYLEIRNEEGKTELSDRSDILSRTQMIVNWALRFPIKNMRVSLSVPKT